MKSIYDHLSAQFSELTTKKYSTSFSLGILFLNKQIRQPVYSIYGFVRLADEIVDSFHDYNQRELLQRFKEDTNKAIKQKISLNPVLNTFQKTVHQFQIKPELIEAFFNSMEMDLDMKLFSKAEYDRYIYGSAEVVGLMCLQVFTGGDTVEYEKLKPYAMKLGSAFQKVNFLRDMQDDFSKLGRIYFPNISEDGFSADVKKEIEAEIEQEFHEALIGIRKLPRSSRGGVYLAYVYYYNLFKKIKRLPAKQIMKKRIRISNGKKMVLMLNSSLQNRMRLV